MEEFTVRRPPLIVACNAFVAGEPSIAQFEDALAVARVLFRVRDLHDGRARRLSSQKSSMISRACVEWRLPVGSSARSSAGAWTTARAMPTSCCWPPESWLGKRSFLATIWKRSRMSATMPCALFGGQVLVGERQVDILGDGEIVEQVIALEDHADALTGEIGALLAIELVGGRLAEPVLAQPAVVEQGEHVEQRRLPRPGWAHDGDVLPSLIGNPTAPIFPFAEVHG